ncbi:MAG: PIG-L family deacetylase [Verrucomicrobiota bacterium]
MKLDFTNERVMAVVAHPDDAELLCAGTLARAKADGATIAICVLCNGDKGQPNKPIKNLKAVRRREMKEAAGLLGAEFFFGDFADATLSDGFPWRLRLIEIYRQFKPSLILAHSAEDYHTDHRAASALAEAASWHCASRGNKSKLAAMDSPPALWWMDTLNMSGFAPDFFVDISHYANLKHEMLACHKSQLARGKDGDFSPLSELMHLQYRARGMQSGVFAAEAFRTHHAFKRARAW